MNVAFILVFLMHVFGCLILYFMCFQCMCSGVWCCFSFVKACDWVVDAFLCFFNACLLVALLFYRWVVKNQQSSAYCVLAEIWVCLVWNVLAQFTSWQLLFHWICINNIFVDKNECCEYCRMNLFQFLHKICKGFNRFLIVAISNMAFTHKLYSDI